MRFSNVTKMSLTLFAKIKFSRKAQIYSSTRCENATTIRYAMSVYAASIIRKCTNSTCHCSLTISSKADGRYWRKYIYSYNDYWQTPRNFPSDSFTLMSGYDWNVVESDFVSSKMSRIARWLLSKNVTYCQAAAEQKQRHVLPGGCRAKKVTYCQAVAEQKQCHVLPGGCFSTTWQCVTFFLFDYHRHTIAWVW